jgi:hypothetical protein
MKVGSSSRGRDPDFKPQYHQKKKKRKEENSNLKYWLTRVRLLTRNSSRSNLYILTNLLNVNLSS